MLEATYMPMGPSPSIQLFFISSPLAVKGDIAVTILTRCMCVCVCACRFVRACGFILKLCMDFKIIWLSCCP